MNIISKKGLQRFHDDLISNYHQNVNNSLPVGSIVAYSGTNTPKNYMLCDGSSLNINEYLDLYNAIGDAYGSDSNDTFKLPDLRNRFIYGSEDDLGAIGGEETHKLTVDEMPAHNHQLATSGYQSSNICLNYGNCDSVIRNNYATGYSGGDQPHNNMPPYIRLSYIIKVANDISIESNEILDMLKDNIIDEVSLRMHPIGSIYISVESTNPSNILRGTWIQLKDRFLLGAGDEYGAGSTGGEAAHTLTIDEIPSHHHNVSQTYGASGEGYNFSKGTAKTERISEDGNYWWNWTASTGGGQSHNNMPPYLTVYMWKRIA